MIRSSKHILKYQTDFKSSFIKKVFNDYKTDLEFYISLILSGKLPLKIFLSSKLLTNNRISHGQWKQIVYKQASEIIRSNIKKAENIRFKRYQKIYSKACNSNKFKKFVNKRFKELNIKSILFTKYFPKINIQNISINIDSRIIDFESNSKMFDEFINIKLPYREPNGKYRKSLTIKLPIKQHKHSLKFKNWSRLKTVQLKKINNNFYVVFFYEKKELEKSKHGKVIGIDQGFRKLIQTSDNKVIGENITFIYNKINRKVQGSNSFKRTLIERDNYINQCINKDLDIVNLKEIIIEDLKNVKHKSKFYKKVNNKLQRWVYPKVVSKLESLCEENGVLLTKVNPAYTSQTCSYCGYVNKENRKGEDFLCLQCGKSIDADYNASINISRMGVYNPHGPKCKNF
jgi:putative transposase